ncbi:MAG: depupylase/deamidase Dop [Candidatus Nanopelagicales bacterium]|nr:depupylase/deamidase Dop [Candidatus Nanopelagicales bacterium]MDZ4250064.1 depupylase/deamidase Dop [Candidatus Nanopelagicales bacterium]
MSVHRVMGIETEYGISVPGQPHANAMLSSSQIVNAYAASALGDLRCRPRWDYDEESPLRDARGFDLTRAEADPGQLTDEDMGLANVILTNGARLYVDHAHPEYSTPEVTNPRDAVVWDKAGERIMERAAKLASAIPHVAPIQLYKNNTDNKGVSYGCHENYLMSRRTPFADVVTVLIPFFVSRQVIAGSGRVGLGQDGRGDGFQLSQRADFFEVEVGLETTVKRPIINTRDEPHADPEEYRRLHVIVGDANLSETVTYLKLGTTALVLSMLEAGEVDAGLMPVDPVAEMHAVSHDPGLAHRIQLRDGRGVTALELQMEFHDRAAKHVAERLGSSVDQMTSDVLDRWISVLDQLRSDTLGLADTLDWVAKKKLLDGYRARDGLDWSADVLQLVDLQYSDVRSDRGLANRLASRGRLTRLTTDEEVTRAITSPPEDTRAWFRGECVRRFGAEVSAASWDSVIFDIAGRQSLQRVPTLDPLRGTKAHVASLIDRARSADELVALLASDH